MCCLFGSEPARETSVSTAIFNRRRLYERFPYPLRRSWDNFLFFWCNIFSGAQSSIKVPSDCSFDIFSLDSREKSCPWMKFWEVAKHLVRTPIETQVMNLLFIHFNSKPIVWIRIRPTITSFLWIQEKVVIVW
jgi:hypothetical protein